MAFFCLLKYIAFTEKGGAVLCDGEQTAVVFISPRAPDTEIVMRFDATLPRLICMKIASVCLFVVSMSIKKISSNFSHILPDYESKQK